MALACALLVSIVAWVKTSGHAHWYSAPHRVRWSAPDGKPIDERVAQSMCRGDIHLKTLIAGDRVWTICGSGGTEPFPDGGVGWLDPVRGEGHVVGAFSEPLSWTVGVLPGPDGSIAFVTAMQKPEHLEVSIAHPQGWKREPTPLPGEGPTMSVAGLLGMSFRGEILEVAVLPESADDPNTKRADPVVVAFSPGAAPVVRVVPRASLGLGQYCAILGAYRRDGETAWRFLVDDWTIGGRGNVEIAEDGTATPLASDVRSIDLTHFGLLGRPLPASATMLLPDGRYVPAEPYNAWSSTNLVVEKDRAAPVPRTYVEGVVPAMEHVVGGRTLRTGMIVREDASVDGGPASHDQLLSIVETSSSHESIVARIHDCTDLPYEGTFLPHDDGWIFVAPSGCYVTLDASLGRVDPWGIVDHLRMRGSMYVSWNEPSHLVELGWPLFGLPIAIVAAYAFRRWTRRGRAAPAVPFVVAGWIFVATAGYALMRVWPLLR